jgi:hypothetical protein
MRQRLKMAQSTLTPESALAQLKWIHRHRIKVNDRALHGVSTLTKDQADLLGALTLQTPTKHEQLSLLQWQFLALGLYESMLYTIWCRTQGSHIRTHTPGANVIVPKLYRSIHQYPEEIEHRPHHLSTIA